MCVATINTHMHNVQKPARSSSRASSLTFKDTSYIELVLRVLGLMCDGQYRLMQNYLREQPDNIKTINLVSEICIFLQSFYVDATKDNIVLINQVIQTLIEMSVVSSFTHSVLLSKGIFRVTSPTSKSFLIIISLILLIEFYKLLYFNSVL